MSLLTLQFDDARTSFRPGERLAGTAAWQLDGDVDFLEIRLLWFTRGKGTQDVGVVDQRHIAAPPRVRQERFEFVLPEQPYSFSGRPISLIWAVELVTPKGKESQRVEFTLSPQGDEIVLGEPAEAP
jgi:hypothetical protein